MCCSMPTKTAVSRVQTSALQLLNMATSAFWSGCTTLAARGMAAQVSKQLLTTTLNFLSGLVNSNLPALGGSASLLAEVAFRRGIGWAVGASLAPVCLCTLRSSKPTCLPDTVLVLASLQLR